MADITQKWKENVEGKIFVDKNCIACDTCMTAAPNNFSMEPGQHAYVSKQPEGPEEAAACQVAIEGCPVEAIGDTGA